MRQARDHLQWRRGGIERLHPNDKQPDLRHSDERVIQAEPPRRVRRANNAVKRAGRERSVQTYAARHQQQPREHGEMAQRAAKGRAGQPHRQRGRAAEQQQHPAALRGKCRRNHRRRCQQFRLRRKDVPSVMFWANSSFQFHAMLILEFQEKGKMQLLFFFVAH